MDEMAAIIVDALGENVDQVVPRLNLNPSGLSIDIYPGDPSRDTAAAGLGEVSGAWIFTVRARVDLGDPDASQDALLRLMDDEEADELSVALALMDDQTLNGFATSVNVEGPSGYIAYVDSPGNMVGIEWRVTVLRATS
jgi:hypothetical protein